MAGTEAKEITAELRSTMKVRPDIRKPVWHCSLSMPPSAGKTGTDAWNAIADDFMRRMGFPEDTVWVAVRHSDKTHDHIHIVASRISLGGKVFTGEFDARRAIRVTQEMEKEYDLTRTKGLDGVGKAMSDGERRRMMRTESLSEKQWLRMVAGKAMRGAATFEDFVGIMKGAGVEVFLVTDGNGKVAGISFSHDSFKVKGSSLGKGFGWNSLRKGFLGIPNIRPVVDRHQHRDRDCRTR